MQCPSKASDLALNSSGVPIHAAKLLMSACLATVLRVSCSPPPAINRGGPGLWMGLGEQ